MSAVERYLSEVADTLKMGVSEKANIHTSIQTLEQRLKSHFGSQIGKKRVYGSYDRDTSLPRSRDSESDVDYLVSFTETNLSQQTYLDRLKNFATAKYSTSEVFQDHPTLVLDFNHIKFEIVPAKQGWNNSYSIPNRKHGWITTDVDDLVYLLALAERVSGYKAKPFIRLMKLWNTRAGYPYESYLLEKFLLSLSYSSSANLKQLQYIAFLSMRNFSTQKQKDEVDRAKRFCFSADYEEKRGNSPEALMEIKKLMRDSG